MKGMGRPHLDHLCRADPRRTGQAPADRRTAGRHRPAGYHGLAAKVLPELPALRLERDEHHRHKDVYQHSLTVLEQAIDLEDRLPQRPDLIIPTGGIAALHRQAGDAAVRTRREGLVSPP